MSKPGSPARELAPSIVPQKRVTEEDHQPAVSSPLNPDVNRAVKDDAPLARERAARSKKESLKKRESKGGPLPTESNSRATPDPKTKTVNKQKPVTGTSTPSAVLAPQRYVLPHPKPSDFQPPRPAALTPAGTFTSLEGSKIQFYTINDHVHNKKDYRYSYCIADPLFPASQFYRQTEAEPFGPRLSFEDAAKDICLDASGRFATTSQGWRVARANVGVRTGRFYWEVKVHRGVDKRTPEEALNSRKHEGPATRVGWARREHPLDMPVGYTGYGYGLRDIAGERLHFGRPVEYFPKGVEIQVGDVIGVEIYLPSESLHRKVVEGNYNPAVDIDDDEQSKDAEAHPIIRDRVPITYRGQLYFEHIEYQPDKTLTEYITNPQALISSTGGGVIGAAKLIMHPTHPNAVQRTLPHSYVKYYKNGKDMGKAFTELLAFLPPASYLPASLGERSTLDDGTLGYYPAVSVIRDSVVEVNFGPDFWFPPPGYSDEESHDDEVDMVGSDHQPVAKAERLRPVSDRAWEQIAEDIVYDLLDEVSAYIDNIGNDSQRLADTAIGGIAMDEDIKELVQDED